MYRMLSLVAAGLTLLGVTHSATAQAPLSDAITYQGVLAQAGVPANGDFDFRFLLFDSLGQQVGPRLCLDDVPVVNGLFRVDLDFGDVFDGRALDLEIEVRAGTAVPCSVETGFTTLSPRTPLTAAPYAQLARTVSDDAITADKLASSAVTSAAIANSTITGADIASDSIFSSDLASSSASLSKVSGGAMTATSGRIGIGTSPASGFVLDVDGNVQVRDGDLEFDGLLPRRSLTLSASVFRPDNNGFAYQFDNGIRGTESGQSVAFTAPVSIPDRAILRDLVVFYFDNASTDVSVSARRINPSVNGSVLLDSFTSSGSPAGLRTAFLSLDEEVDDGDALDVKLSFVTPPFGQDLRVIGFVVRYDLLAVQ